MGHGKGVEGEGWGNLRAFGILKNYLVDRIVFSSSSENNKWYISINFLSFMKKNTNHFVPSKSCCTLMVIIAWLLDIRTVLFMSSSTRVRSRAPFTGSVKQWGLGKCQQRVQIIQNLRPLPICTRRNIS